MEGEVIFMEWEVSTNLTTGVLSGDFCFKQSEADTMLFSAFANLRSGNYTGTVGKTLVFMFKQNLFHNILEATYLKQEKE